MSRIVRPISRALANSGSAGESRSVEFRVRREAPESSSAQFVWVEMRCRALDQAAVDGAGEREVVAVMRDITKRKEQETALEEARAEAERANAAKSRFLATMSHELRTPLNAIIGFSEMLTKEGSLMIDAKRRHDYAHLINDSGHHLLSVVNGILDMSKIETGNFEITPEPFAPRQVIEECCDTARLQGARDRNRSGRRPAGRSAGDGRRQAIAAPDHAQSDLQRDQVHQARRQGHRERAGRCGQCLGRRRGYRRRHRLRRSAAHRRSVLPGSLVLRPPSRRHRTWACRS